jgi:hypothetical protein
MDYHCAKVELNTICSELYTAKMYKVTVEFGGSVHTC